MARELVPKICEIPADALPFLLMGFWAELSNHNLGIITRPGKHTKQMMGKSTIFDGTLFLSPVSIANC
jgi:hypothetical protein